MSRRSRARRQTRTRLPLFVLAALLLVGAGAWWWSQRGDDAAAPTAASEAPAGARVAGRVSEVLDLPPVEQTRPTLPSVPDLPTAAPAPSAETATLPAFLPPEARRTLTLIRQGGPFPHRQDGAVFQNREGRLPRQGRGYYREYTVDTPGLDHRGARRIVAGGRPPREYYYTDDHYESFRRFEIPGAAAARSER